MNRRLRFSIVVVISQLLLIALAISWFIHMVLIQVNGSVYFIEKEPIILWAEIIITVMIITFSSFVLVAQIKRLGEKRQTDRRAEYVVSEKSNRSYYKPSQRDL